MQSCAWGCMCVCRVSVCVRDVALTAHYLHLPPGQIILFIDEMHMLLGAGAGGAGTVDAANLLKPLLSRGKLRCIGATTLNEYKKHVEKGALSPATLEPSPPRPPPPTHPLLIASQSPPPSVRDWLCAPLPACTPCLYACLTVSGCACGCGWGCGCA